MLKLSLANIHRVVQVYNHDEVVAGIVEFGVDTHAFYAIKYLFALEQACRHRGDGHFAELARLLSLAVRQKLFVLKRVVKQVIRVDFAKYEHVTGHDMVVLPLELYFAVVSRISKL